MCFKVAEAAGSEQRDEMADGATVKVDKQNPERTEDRSPAMHVYVGGLEKKRGEKVLWRLALTTVQRCCRAAPSPECGQPSRSCSQIIWQERRSAVLPLLARTIPEEERENHLINALVFQSRNKRTCRTVIN
jgi:hypothetical protein